MHTLASMETMKRTRPEHGLVLSEVLDDQEAWGTEFGARIFAKINLRLLSTDEGTLVAIDYGGVKRSDVSFQREAVVETLRKHRPRLLFIAANLTDPDVRENLVLALEKRGDWLLARDRPRQPTVLGKRLPEEHQATLERVWSAGVVVSSQLVTSKVNLSTASSRLYSLWKSGLIERVEGTASSGGREHRYYPIF